MAEHEELDPIWASTKTSRQIAGLGEVEKSIGKLLTLAASSVSLLTLPQTDSPDDPLPQGEERIEKFVLEVGDYFETLNSVQEGIRSTLAHIRHARTAPTAIEAPPAGFVPPNTGVSLDIAADGKALRGLQESRIERDAWTGILDALKRLKAAQEEENVDVEMDIQGTV
ncbi:hypothetical protein CYLTODRAFT_420765 [Cylindrobasidium torrendii FP15055 ss-10]|uniref:Mediator of RNA polymerase II transcription subunit 11 n=1 Tax=Cylindrobasidium torrendii FP15055 ss-10 TaxID=1314674 RepID=A0A0D7BH05_9AGAR|nr:hypothetical protein CYLTODRAFT_420765 [Cylindrobasidium torrendii FP15055 ss-10]